MRHAATLIFSGRLEPGSFAAFVRHRARRLSIGAEIGEQSAERIAVTVVGDEDLIDAFEMACSLGPIDCIVLDTAREGEAGRRAVADAMNEASA